MIFPNSPVFVIIGFRGKSFSYGLGDFYHNNDDDDDNNIIIDTSQRDETFPGVRFLKKEALK